MSIKLLTGSKGKNFCQSWTMLAELVRNNFINDRVTVNSRERLSRTNIRQASVLYNNTEGPKTSQSRPTRERLFDRLLCCIAILEGI